MANQYFINQSFSKEEIQVAPATAHHLFHVMRLQDGEEIEIVFQDKRRAKAEIISAAAAKIKVIDEIYQNNELPIEVTLALGFPKGDKLDFVVEKATELGATAIWAAPFAWSVAKWDQQKLTKKQEKLVKIAIAAAEQSKRNRIPQVQLFDKLTDMQTKFSEFDEVLVAYEESAKAGEAAAMLKAVQKKPQKLLVIFGPEGGISPAEIASFTAQGAQLAGLGPRILRAETAPLYVLAAISSLTELQTDSTK